MESITERVKKLIETHKLTPAAFADRLKVQRSGISHILSGRNKPSLDLIQRILEQFQDVDSAWLLTGKTAMPLLKKEEHTNNKHVTNINEPPTSEITNVNMMENSSINSNPLAPQIEQKKIEKIVIFYSDKTFSERLPE